MYASSIKIMQCITVLQAHSFLSPFICNVYSYQYTAVQVLWVVQAWNIFFLKTLKSNTSRESESITSYGLLFSFDSAL